MSANSKFTDGALATYLLAGGAKQEGKPGYNPGMVPFIEIGNEQLFFNGSVRDALRRVLCEQVGENIAETQMQDPNVLEQAFATVRMSLRSEYERVIDKDISIDKVRAVYLKVLKGIIRKALQENKVAIERGDRPLFTEKVTRSLRSGYILATEDFHRCLLEDADNFLQQVIGLDPTQMKKASVRDFHLREAAIDFQRRFDEADLLFIRALGLAENKENDSVLKKRIQDRLSEAVRFLELIHKYVHKYQLDHLADHAEAGLLHKVEGAPLPKDLASKPLYHLAETVNYPSRDDQYAVGFERKFMAQLLIVLSLLYNQIHRYDAFIASSETARLLNDILNYHLNKEIGRKGSALKGVFVSRKDERGFEPKDGHVPMTGLTMVRLDPLTITNEEGKEETLFPAGIDVMVDSRVKSPDAILIKVLNKGSVRKVNDFVAFRFAIDDRDMTPEQIVDTVRGIRKYIKAMWKIGRFVQLDPKITNDQPIGDVSPNPVSDKDYLSEKVVFHRQAVSDNGGIVLVPVEAQIELLSRYLEANSAVGPKSHARYEGKRVVVHDGFKQLYPAEIFGALTNVIAAAAGQVYEGVEGENNQERRGA